MGRGAAIRGFGRARPGERAHPPYIVRMCRDVFAGSGPAARPRPFRGGALLVLLALAGTAALVPARGAAQAVPRPDSTPPLVLERVTRDRWVHEGQHPGFVPFQEVVDGIQVRVFRFGASPRRSMTVRIRNLAARVTLDEGNAVVGATVDQPALGYSRFEDAAERVDIRRRLLSGRGAALNLPWARLWDVPFHVPPGVLAPGRAWTDTLSLMAGPTEGLSERLEGVRHSRVVGDTAVGGRRLPLVRTESDVRYRSTEIVDDASREGSFTIERDVRGTVLGAVAVDTALGIRAVGADSAEWSGEALLHTPEGRTFTSGMRYQRTRTWSLRDSAAWADSARGERERAHSGMLILPSTPLQERLAAGDSAAADSLLARWRDTVDPDERAGVEATLMVWWARGSGRGDALRTQLGRMRREAGDSTDGLVPLTGSMAAPLTAARAMRLLPYLDDPGRLWRIGIVPRWTYNELASVLLAATPILQPDSTKWGCEPAACALFLSALETAREPRLRDAALVGAFARDPTRWYARLRARADSGSRVVGGALTLAEGVGAPWPAAPKDPMPPAGSDWRTWLSWMGGTVRFEGTHRDALRMYAARTGRDPAAELQAAWPPEGDSARLVLGTILRGMGRAPVARASNLAAEVLSGSGARLELAVRSLRGLLAREGSPAPPELAAGLLGEVLDSILAGGDSPWPAVAGFGGVAGGRVLHPFAVDFHGVPPVPLFIRAESLPAGFPERLPAPLQAVDSAAWAARPPREGGAILEFYPVRTVGDFVELHWRWTVLRRRGPDESPSGYAGGGGLTLIHTAEGWRVVASNAWIT
jgi:hypothetical protein